MAALSHLQFTAYVGIDWADTKHDICLQAAGDTEHQFDCIPHQVARIDEWAKALHQRYGGPIAVALELAKGPSVAALQKYDFFVLFPINPSTLAKYRVAFKPSRAKDDPTDAELALDLLLRHPERFTPLKPQSAAMRSLLSLNEQRRELVNDKTRFTNRLCNTLKPYYPQALDWFEQTDTVLFCDFLNRWPTLMAVKRARKTTLEAFFHAHNGRRAKLIEARLQSIRVATPLTEDPGIVAPAACMSWRWWSSYAPHSLRSIGSTRKSLRSLLRYPIMLCSRVCRAPAPIWRRACSMLLVNSATAFKGLMNY